MVAEGRARSVGRAGAGLAAGVLTTTISANGPPLALWLDAEGVRGREMRDTLQVLFAGFNLAGVGGARRSHELPASHTVAMTALLLPGLVAGLIAGAGGAAAVAGHGAPAGARGDLRDRRRERLAGLL